MGVVPLKEFLDGVSFVHYVVVHSVDANFIVILVQLLEDLAVQLDEV